jgi:L,D-transpeptidase catalytic domain
MELLIWVIGGGPAGAPCAGRKVVKINLSILALLLTLASQASSKTAAESPWSDHLKRVEIDKANQMLRAYEGDRLVFQSHISSGKYDRSTPNGRFRAGEKHRIHYSRLYHHAPMPFSVQVTGNCFIHGYAAVPDYPASHGCIRLSLSDGNPARQFYNWVESGTPIDIEGRWTAPQRRGLEVTTRRTTTRGNGRDVATGRHSVVLSNGKTTSKVGLPDAHRL